MPLVKRTDLPGYEKAPEHIKVSSEESTQEAATGAVFVPLEILGELINPFDPSSPYVLQGSFLQLTNLSSSKTSNIQLRYVFNQKIAASSSNGKIAFAANFINNTSNVFDLTSVFLSYPLGTTTFFIPPLATFIIGLEYGFAPPGSQTTQDVAAGTTEALGNRGSVTVTPDPQTTFLVTPTIRQTFATSGASIISSSAYAVPVSAGPIVSGA